MSLEGKCLDIAVVGGSLGGLFAAIPLLRMPQKHRVTILERNGRPLLHDQGAGIVAGGHVQKWIEKFDLFGKETRVSFVSFDSPACPWLWGRAKNTTHG
jgi:2-polyprenyl-6-methoxyphenol hydroxylase-like FAD-dependent oxidoreductase